MPRSFRDHIPSVRAWVRGEKKKASQTATAAPSLHPILKARVRPLLHETGFPRRIAGSKLNEKFLESGGGFRTPFLLDNIEGTGFSFAPDLIDIDHLVQVLGTGCLVVFFFFFSFSHLTLPPLIRLRSRGPRD